MSPDNGEIIKINHLSKSFGSHVVLRDIDFSVLTGDVTCIIGASGSGKSTLLRCINMLETPTSGEVLYHGEDIQSGEIKASSYRARVGMVFQSFNLFSNMSVLGNCVIGQRRVLKKDKKSARENALVYLEKSGWPLTSTRSRVSSPGDSSRESRLRARSRWNRSSCFLMSRPPRSTRRWSGKFWMS